MRLRIGRFFWIPLVVVLTGCVPRVLEIPDYLADTPVVFERNRAEERNRYWLSAALRFR